MIYLKKFETQAAYNAAESSDVGSCCYCWSSSLSTSGVEYAYFFYSHDGGMEPYDNDRAFGFSVRGVLDE